MSWGRCSERERAAMGAEREIDAYYGTLWARDHVGERFAGTIDGAAEIGLFVEIDGHLVSGLVASDSLGSGAELEPKAHRFILGRTGATLGIGDAVEVEIVSANVARRQIDLALVGTFGTHRALSRGGEEARPAQAPRASRPPPPAHSERPAQSVRSGSVSLSERLAQVRREQSGRKGQSKRSGHSGRPSGKPGKSGHDRPGQRQGQAGKSGPEQSGQRQGPPGGKKKGPGGGTRRQGNKHRGRRR
jgi:ribonuclease R